MNKEKKVLLCAIANISSGTCDQDCTFCAQSAKYKADISRYHKKPIDTIVTEANQAREAGAAGFCLVTAGLGLDDAKVEFVSQAAHAVKKAQPDLNIIACNGIATLDHLKELKKAGVGSYNHNLETAKEFYQTVCSSHSWEDRFATCMAAKEADLKLCSGGIFGLGETDENRKSFLSSLQELSPNSTPVNFFHPNEALPLAQKPMTREEALAIVKLVKSYLPTQRIMIAGGRELIFGDDFIPLLEAGAHAIVIGNYLTTVGAAVSKDREILTQAGYEIILKCES